MEPERPVRIYQVRLLNAWGFRVRAVEVEWPDDDAALDAMERFSGLFPIELWEDGRLVARYESDPPRRILGQQGPEPADENPGDNPAGSEPNL
jgi:hypothetical protein